MYYFVYHVLPQIASVVIGLYLWLHFFKLPFISVIGKKWKFVPWFLAVLLVEVCVLIGTDIWTIGAVVVLNLCLAFIICDLINLILRKLKLREQKKGIHFWKYQFQERIPPGKIRGLSATKVYYFWRKIYFDGLLALGITVLILVGGFINIRNVQYTDYHISTEKAGMEDGLFIILISDVHLGTTMTVEEFEDYCKEIEEQKPDMLVVAGDLVDENTPEGEMEKACKILGNLSFRYGTFFIYGNHDMGTHGGNPYFDKKDIQKHMLANNVHLLYDKVELVDDRFYVIGRKDAGTVNKRKRKSVEELTFPLSKDRFILMLDHQPYELKREAEAGVDLQLSGHTHGGQIWPVGVLTELFGLNEMNYGYREDGFYQVVVSSGMGGFAYPIRTGSRSEIVRIWINK